MLVVPTEQDEKFTVPRKVACMSELVRTMAEGGANFSTKLRKKKI